MSAHPLTAKREEAAMSQTIQSYRRSSLTAAAAAGGRLSLGWSVPKVAAQGSTGADLGIWAVIQPDDTTTIRIARSEMGQGTLTGLAQLVAEELECDWSKVTTEFPTPGQSVARKRAWGDFSTGGSRG